jgi:hypothetical protein
MSQSTAISRRERASEKLGEKVITHEVVVICPAPQDARAAVKPLEA